MGRGQRQTALTAKGLLYGRRKITAVEKKVGRPQRKSAHSRFNYARRRLGISKEGVIGQGKWWGTQYWAVTNGEGLTERFGIDKNAKLGRNLDREVEKRLSGETTDVELGPIEESGSGHSRPGAPRYIRQIESSDKQKINFSVNADFIEVVERSNGRDGDWRFNSDHNLLIYYCDNKAQGIVLPRRNH